MTETSKRKAANKEFHKLGTRYHDGLALREIDAILESHGFNPMEPGIYCGRDGKVHEQVGANTWLSLNWHKMEVTGRYEVVVYLS